MKLFSTDERIIASKILEKISEIFNLSDFKAMKGYKITTSTDDTISKIIICSLMTRLTPKSEFQFPKCKGQMVFYSQNNALGCRAVMAI